MKSSDLQSKYLFYKVMLTCLAVRAQSVNCAKTNQILFTKTK